MHLFAPSDFVTFSLQSGSNGNSIYVEAGGFRLIVDAGISARQAELRAAEHGRTLVDADAILVSHEHQDHVCAVGTFHRRFRAPIYVSRRTYAKTRGAWGRVHDVRHFRSGEPFRVGPVTVCSLPTPHDAVDGVAFILEYDGRRLGILTDLGHPFRGLHEVLGGVDGAYLESNYDPAMLRSGSYPEDLKARIAGPHGHLSNDEAASLTRSVPTGRLRWLALAHLSEANNHPDLALGALRQRCGDSVEALVAPRDRVSPLLSL